MTVASPLVLFVPVSGTAGTGEYQRCRIVAEAALRRWPGLRVAFVLSRQAPYAARAPFQTHLVERSPTFETAAVCEVLRHERPAVVVFDNAGRTAQLATARGLGARTVYVSRRPARRRKAFRLRWLRLLDAHWIAFPPFVDGPLGTLERLKLRLFPDVEVVFLGAVLADSEPERRAAVRAGIGIGDERYVLFVPGGGTRHGGADAPRIFAAAATPRPPASSP